MGVNEKLQQMERRAEVDKGVERRIKASVNFVSSILELIKQRICLIILVPNKLSI